MAFIFAMLLLAGLGLAGINDVIKDLYSQFVTGIMGLYLVFCGGNVSNKWVLTRNGGSLTQSSLDQPPQGEDGEK